MTERTRVDVRLSRELKKRIEELAERDRRSTNAQIVFLLAVGMQSYRPVLKEHLVA